MPSVACTGNTWSFYHHHPRQKSPKQRIQLQLYQAADHDEFRFGRMLLIRPNFLFIGHQNNMGIALLTFLVVGLILLLYIKINGVTQKMARGPASKLIYTFIKKCDQGGGG